MKIKELKGILGKNKLDAALFYSIGMIPNPNMVYFAQYYGAGALIVPKKQSPFLIVPEMEYERAKKSMIKKLYSMDKKKFFESINSIIKTIKKAFDYANKIITVAIKNFKSFNTESEAAAFLEYKAKKLGLETSFPP